eukprot:m.361789 g.361789  ORF g.361789 m.361789 type:complete len:448 (+) comp20782_c0_seq1:84-1427(+)
MSAAESPHRGDSHENSSVNTATPAEQRSIDPLRNMVTALSDNKIESLASKLNAIDNRATGLPAEAINLLGNQFLVDRHSLGWLEILLTESSRFEHISKQEFASMCCKFFLECNADQIRLCPVKFTELAAAYSSVAVKTDASGAVLPLYTAVLKLRPSSQHLTGIHAELVKVCLKSQCHHVARRILDDDIVHIDDRKSGTTALSVLLYFYYGGLTYAASRKYDRALQFFSTALSLPSDSVSAVMVEAYKKYTVLCILQHGKPIDLPEYARFIVRSIKPFVTPYVELSNAFLDSEDSAFLSVVEKHHSTFAEDRNIGLLQQCQERRTRRSIQKLTQTFLTLSLDAIAERVGLDRGSIEALLVQMISDGAIHATIDQPHGTVVFREDNDGFDTEESLARLQECITATGQLYDRIKDIDTELRTAPKYVKKMSQGKDDNGDMVVDTFDDAV